MTTHTLNSLKSKNTKVYNNFKNKFEYRLEELYKLKDVYNHNLKLVKRQIENNKKILKSQIPIEAILRTKND